MSKKKTNYGLNLMWIFYAIDKIFEHLLPQKVSFWFQKVAFVA